MSYNNYNQYRDNSTRPIHMGNSNSNNAFLEKAEEFANNCLHKTQHVLPHIARLCLVSTFIEDGIRMIYQWSEQRDYISSTWKCGWFLAVLFVMTNLFGQISASIMVLSRKKVELGAYILFGIILLQTIAYSILWDLKFLARSLSMVGGVLLILAENKKDTRNVFNAVPMMDDPNKTSKSYMQLSGRILLVLMFVSLLRFTSGIMEIFRNLIGCVLIVLITLGYKTKLFSVIMVVWLLILNMIYNDFWRHRSASIMYDFKKYDFFQAMTVVGGLLVLIIIGPGGISIDERKKMY